MLVSTIHLIRIQDPLIDESIFSTCWVRFKNCYDVMQTIPWNKDHPILQAVYIRDC